MVSHSSTLFYNPSLGILYIKYQCYTFFIRVVMESFQEQVQYSVSRWFQFWGLGVVKRH